MKNLLPLLFAIASLGIQGSSPAQDQLDLPAEVRVWFRNPDGCLTGSTPVLTDAGPVAISRLNPAVHKLLYLGADGKVSATNAYSAFTTQRTDDLRQLTTVSGVTIVATPGHRLARLNVRGPMEYVPLERLSPGDKLVGYRETQVVESVEKVIPTQPVEMWDIENRADCLDHQGNFFAAEILVSNSCVQCSIGMAGVWQNCPQATTLLWDTEYGPAVRGGSNPSRVEGYCDRRGIPAYNITGSTTFDWMKWAAKTGRMAAIGCFPVHFQTEIWYNPDPSDTKPWKICNNNSPNRIDEYSESEFRRHHLASGQWVVVLKTPPPPAKPVYVAWWQ